MEKEYQFLSEATVQTVFKEDKEAEKKNGVLKTVTGCVADFKPNRNGRVYPKELWENVLKSEYVNELMANNIFVGELDHPEERSEVSLQEISHAISKLWIDEDKQEVWATMDILDTPNGQIVANLVDYGAKIGVSSRGAGSVQSNGQVNPDDYQLFTFDIVGRPSVAAARPEIYEQAKNNVKTLTEGEIANILNNYKNIPSKIDDIVNSSNNINSGYTYITEGETKTIQSEFFNKLQEDLLKD